MFVDKITDREIISFYNITVYQPKIEHGTKAYREYVENTFSSKYAKIKRIDDGNAQLVVGDKVYDVTDFDFREKGEMRLALDEHNGAWLEYMAGKFGREYSTEFKMHRKHIKFQKIAKLTKELDTVTAICESRLLSGEKKFGGRNGR